MATSRQAPAPQPVAPTPANSGAGALTTTPRPDTPHAPAPRLSDTTGEALFPEINTYNAPDSVLSIPELADSNLIDDPSKEWK